MGKILIIRSYPINLETRANKIINSFNKNTNNQIYVYDWNSVDGNREESKGNIFTHYSFRGRYSNPIQYIIQYILFTLNVIKIILKVKPDIIHPIQITSAFPVFIYSLFHKCKVVYDILDVYEDTINTNQIARYVIMLIDKTMIKRFKNVILVDKCQIEEFNGLDNANITIIYDSPKDINNISYTKNPNFMIFFGGKLDREKNLNLETMKDAVLMMPDSKFIIAGSGNEVEKIKEWENKNPNQIKYIGELNHVDLLDNAMKSELLFVLRDNIPITNKYTCGSKILESMMLGKPFIAPENSSAGKIVVMENMGYTSNNKDSVQLASIIRKLIDNPDLYLHLSNNARMAYDTKFGWPIMEQKLLELYSTILET